MSGPGWGVTCLRVAQGRDAEAAGAATGVLLGAVAQAIILFTALVIGVQNIGIDVTFLTTLMIVIVTMLLAGGVMAFGLGSKTLVANIIGAQHTRKHCKVGEHMSIGDVQGTISEVTQRIVASSSDTDTTLCPIVAS